MGIIIKFIFRSIKEKKFRTFLIVFAVMLSTALFFASLALSGTIEKTFMERIKKYIGNADIIIHANEKSPFWLFRLAKTAVAEQLLDYAVGSVETTATYKTLKETINIDLKGYYLDDLARLSPYTLAGQTELLPFIGHKIIISQKTAEKYHFKLGADVELQINENRFRFKIVGIAQPSGLFQDDGRSNTAVSPRETLARLYGAPGQVSMAYLKLKNPQQSATVLQKLSEEYRRYVVREPFSRAEIRQYTQAVTIPFFIMLVLVLFISIFIIYSSFKVITRERLPIIGTFRSIGATRKMTDLVLLTESVLYGTIGGITGYLLGLGILYIMAGLMRPEWAKNSAITLIYTPSQVGAAFLMAIILPLISSCFPIIKIAKLPVKDIIFNRMEQPKKRNPLRLILGLCFFGFGLIAPRLTSRELALTVDVISMLLAVSAVILLVPFLTAGFIKIFEWLYNYILGNEGVLAAKNLRENKSILNNIALLAIGISSLLMINTVSFSVVKEVANFYKDAAFDLWMYSYQADRRFTAVLRSIDGVSEVYGVYGARGTELAGGKEKINLIHGIVPDRYFDFWHFPLTGVRSQLFKELDAGRNILLSNIIKEKLQVREGDELVLKMKRGERVYKVIGFFNSLMWGGSFGLVSERYLKWDMQLQYYDNLFIKTSQNPARVAELIKKQTVRHRPWIETLENMNRQDIQENRQLFLLLQGFAVMTLVIGLFGVFNNLMISFLERKRSLAMMRSVGMSRGQTLKIIFIEALTGGIIGGSVGLLAGTVLIGLVPFVLQAINQVVPIHYSVKEFGIAFLSGVVITVAASIGPALKSSRFNIIEAIKYE